MENSRTIKLLREEDGEKGEREKETEGEREREQRENVWTQTLDNQDISIAVYFSVF